MNEPTKTDKLLKTIGIVTILTCFLFVGVLLGTLAGWLAGWVVGWFFADPILRFFAQLGIKDISMGDLGLSLGFISAFFHYSRSSKKD